MSYPTTLPGYEQWLDTTGNAAPMTDGELEADYQRSIQQAEEVDADAHFVARMENLDALLANVREQRRLLTEMRDAIAQTLAKLQRA